MNYGYAPTPHDKEIAGLISEMLQEIPANPRGIRAYVEVNQLYPGVRIRSLTHYSEAEVEKIVKKADAIHESIIRKHSGRVE